jgi:hypothetical protein
LNGLERCLIDICRLLVEDVHRAAHSVATIEGSLGTAKNLNSFYIPKCCCCRGEKILGVNPVDVGSDTGITAKCSEVPADPSNRRVIGLNSRRRNEVL